jgi:uncharacterized protein (DUF1697 family)
MAGTRPQTWVALLRGVNLGSHKKIAMADLRELVAGIGGEGVTTYVQSGNVVFRSGGERDELRQTIERQIRTRLGHDVTVVLRTSKELERLVAASPFAEREADPTRLHVSFLAAAPEPRRVNELERAQLEPDELRVVRNDVYLHMPNGYGRSRLGNALIEKQLRVGATTRNWRTVTKLAELARRVHDERRRR